jgi:peptidoglycan lytic transglycosylase D
MKPWAFLAAASLTVGCASTGHLVGTPDPVQPESEPSVAASPVPVVAESPAPPSVTRAPLPGLDSVALQKLAADSARDAEVLEQLQEAEPATPDSGADLDGASMFDINVARYADNPRVHYYLDFFQGPARERMTVWLQRLPKYEPMVRRVFSEHGLPSDLVYLGIVESGFSNTAVSRSRAVGMWQFMRATGREYGLRIDRWVDERRDPVKATDAAARYLADLTAQFGSHYLAAAAYNGGAGRVQRGLRRLGDPPAADEADQEDAADEAIADDQFFRLSDTRYLRRETKDYVPKLIAAAMIAKQPEKYGFPPIPETDPFAVDSLPVTKPTSLEVVARVSGTPLDQIVSLNPSLLRRVTPPGATSWIRVPVGKALVTSDSLATLPADDRVLFATHTVRRGETMGGIAARYGISPGELTDLNPRVHPRSLRVGSELRVPSRTAGRVMADEVETERAPGGIHVVRRGETLGGIANRFGTTISSLQAMNELGRSTEIRVGQRLVVSGGRGSSRARTSAKSRTSAKAKGPAATHLVRRGETLSDLSRRYGVSVKTLMRINGLRSASSLRAGQRIKTGA